MVRQLRNKDRPRPKSTGLRGNAAQIDQHQNGGDLWGFSAEQRQYGRNEADAVRQHRAGHRVQPDQHFEHQQAGADCMQRFQCERLKREHDIILWNRKISGNIFFNHFSVRGSTSKIARSFQKFPRFPTIWQESFIFEKLPRRTVPTSAFWLFETKLVARIEWSKTIPARITSYKSPKRISPHDDSRSPPCCLCSNLN